MGNLFSFHRYHINYCFTAIGHVVAQQNRSTQSYLLKKIIRTL